MKEETAKPMARSLKAEQEAEVIRRVFKGNDYLLKAIKALLYGQPITEQEGKLIESTFSDKEVLNTFVNKFFPRFERNDDLPLNSVSDIWLGQETDIKGNTKDTIYQVVESKKVMIEHLKKAVKLLTDTKAERVDLSVRDTIIDPLQINLLARNIYIRSVAITLEYINSIANTPVVTEKEKEIKKLKNSSK